MASISGTRDRLDLAAWTGSAILAECGTEHSRHNRRLTEHYSRYFAAHPERASGHPLLARDLAHALPDGWAHLGELIPRRELHRWHLSGKSSQVLGLGLLGAARERDPSGQWLLATLKPALPSSSGMALPSMDLEHVVRPGLLNEQPRQTAIDLLVTTDDLIICAELKWAEAGLGHCGCRRGGGDPTVATCATRVVARTAYWTAAEEVLGLPRRRPGRLCPVSWTYQATRNIAAARALANGRTPVFALIYDQRNPFFAGHGLWPGWPAVLERTIHNYSGSDVSFASASWQELAPTICGLPRMASVREWARAKHQLPV